MTQTRLEYLEQRCVELWTENESLKNELTFLKLKKKDGSREKENTN